MGILSLQEMCLIELGRTLWTKQGMEKYMIKQKNGVAQVENGLKDLKNYILVLPLAKILKNRLIHVTERIGYEIFAFTTKSQLNHPELSFKLRDIEWCNEGLINEKSTYERYFGRNPSLFLNFECMAIVCAEKELREIWPKVRSDIKRLKMHNLLVSYWVHNLQNNLDDFIGSRGHFIVGLEPDKSVNYNMILYCLNLNFTAALPYFFTRLSSPEQRLLAGEEVSVLQVSLLKRILKNPRQEHFKYICGFLEKPVTDPAFFELIRNHMPADGVLEFINYLLRQINFFGHLHYKIFKQMFVTLSNEVKSIITSKLDFYVLNLLAKGHFETFEFSLQNSKNILRQQIRNRLEEGRGLGLFYTVCRNNQGHLLERLISYLSENDSELVYYLRAVLDEP